MDFDGYFGFIIPLDITKLIWNFVNFDDENFLNAASSGHLSMVQWFHKHYKITDFPVRRGENAMFRIAARNGHLHILIWTTKMFKLDTRDAESYNNAACQWAATKGHLNVLKWLKKHFNIKPDTKSVFRAAFESRIDVLNWIYEQNGVDKVNICEVIECLEWIGETKRRDELCNWLFDHFGK